MRGWKFNCSPGQESCGFVLIAFLAIMHRCRDVSAAIFMNIPYTQPKEDWQWPENRPEAQLWSL